MSTARSQIFMKKNRTFAVSIPLILNGEKLSLKFETHIGLDVLSVTMIFVPIIWPSNPSTQSIRPSGRLSCVHQQCGNTNTPVLRFSSPYRVSEYDNSDVTTTIVSSPTKATRPGIEETISESRQELLPSETIDDGAVTFK